MYVYAHTVSYDFPYDNMWAFVVHVHMMSALHGMVSALLGP